MYIYINIYICYMYVYVYIYIYKFGGLGFQLSSFEFCDIKTSAVMARKFIYGMTTPFITCYEL